MAVSTRLLGVTVSLAFLAACAADSVTQPAPDFSGRPTAGTGSMVQGAGATDAARVPSAGRPGTGTSGTGSMVQGAGATDAARIPAGQAGGPAARTGNLEPLQDAEQPFTQIPGVTTPAQPRR